MTTKNIEELSQPILVEESNVYNLVCWQKKYYGLPKSLGAIDLNSADVSQLEGVLVESSLEELKAQTAAIEEERLLSQPPQFVEESNDYNLVSWQKKYYGLPKSLGAIDLTTTDVSQLERVLVELSLEEIKAQIAAIEEERLLFLPPRFVEEFGVHNLVYWQKKYYGIPQYLGDVDITVADVSSSEKIFVEQSLEQLKKLINIKSYEAGVHPTPLTEFGLPEVIQIEPTHTCNLRCVMCHVSYGDISKAKIDVPRFTKQLRGLEGKWVLVGHSHEPVAHPQFADLVRALSDAGAKIGLISNGTLFTDSLIKKIADCNFGYVTFSFDGCRKETYESIRRNANYERSVERILAFKNAVSQANPRTYFAVNNTIMSRNVNEIVETVDFWEKHGMDHLGLILMVTRDNNDVLAKESLSGNLELVYEQLDTAARKVIENNYKITLSSAHYGRPFPLKEAYPDCFVSSVVKSRHPEAKTPFNPISYFQNGSYPGMQVGCRSPFKAIRIDYNGNVFFCENQFLIGNVYEQNLLDIWYGDRAERVRNGLLNDPKTCYVCDYYNFCIKAGEVDYDKEGSFEASCLEGPINPKQIVVYGLYVIFLWRKTYYAVPWRYALSQSNYFDIRLDDPNKFANVYTAQSLESIKLKIIEASLPIWFINDKLKQRISGNWFFPLFEKLLPTYTRFINLLRRGRNFLRKGKKLLKVGHNYLEKRKTNHN